VITDTYLKQWEEARPRIEAGIEKHRKGDAVVRVLDRNGKPLAGQPVQVEQIASSFLFGANLFMIDAYQGEQVRRYEQAYTRLFNAGTIALYWRDLEPLPGQLSRRIRACSTPARSRSTGAISNLCRGSCASTNPAPSSAAGRPWMSPSSSLAATA